MTAGLWSMLGHQHDDYVLKYGGSKLIPCADSDEAFRESRSGSRLDAYRERGGDGPGLRLRKFTS